MSKQDLTRNATVSRPSDLDKNLVKQSLVDQLAEQLLNYIVSRGLDEGDKLPSTAEISRQFGVSVLVVREAVAVLVGRGVVGRQQGRESVVKRPGVEVFDSLFRVRTAQDGISVAEMQQCRAPLELQAVALAATAKTPTERRRALQSPLDALKRADTLNQLRDADQAFHEAIFELSGNRALTLIIQSLRSALRQGVEEHWRRSLTELSSEPRDSAIVRHQRILDAIVAGQRDEAVEAMAEHFLAWSEYVDFGQIATVRSSVLREGR